MLEPLTETNSDESFRLICRDAESVDIEVQSNVTPEPNETHFFGELYAVRVLANDNEFPSSVVYIVSSHKQLYYENVVAQIACFVRQTDSAYVKMAELALNTSYSVTVSIFNAMMEYRHLPHTMPIRTLPSKMYRPQIIPGKSINASEITINENPKVADVCVKWAPAEGMCFCAMPFIVNQCN